MENNMIGLTGVARSGKDTFFSILKRYLKEKNIESQRIALADNLKYELGDFVKDKFKIDLAKCDGSDKELIRPLMVSYGKCRRIQTEGKYWTSLVEPKIKDLNKSNVLPIITDIRYIEYKEDEYTWLKAHNGILIHISRKLDDGTLVPPANIEEKSNDNKLKAVADYSVSWETCQDVNFLYELMQKHLKNIYEKFLENKK
jgi:hypothetical protein